MEYHVIWVINWSKLVKKIRCHWIYLDTNRKHIAIGSFEPIACIWHNPIKPPTIHNRSACIEHTMHIERTLLFIQFSIQCYLFHLDYRRKIIIRSNACRTLPHHHFSSKSIYLRIVVCWHIFLTIVACCWRWFELIWSIFSTLYFFFVKLSCWCVKAPISRLTFLDLKYNKGFAL